MQVADTESAMLPVLVRRLPQADGCGRAVVRAVAGFSSMPVLVRLLLFALRVPIAFNAGTEGLTGGVRVSRSQAANLGALDTLARRVFTIPA